MDLPYGACWQFLSGMASTLCLPYQRPWSMVASGWLILERSWIWYLAAMVQGLGSIDLRNDIPGVFCSFDKLKKVQIFN